MFSSPPTSLFFNEVALGLYDVLKTSPEPLAGPDDVLPGDGGHGGDDGGLQLVHCVVGPSIDVLLQNAPQIVVKGVTVWAAGRPDLLPPERRDVLLQPVLGLLGVVSRGTVLLKDVVTSPGNRVHPRLDNIIHDLQVLVSIDFEAFRKEKRRHDVTLV